MSIFWRYNTTQGKKKVGNCIIPYISKIAETYRASRLLIAALKATNLLPASLCKLVEYGLMKLKYLKMLLLVVIIPILYEQ